MRSQLISQSARLRHNLTESVKFENIFEKKNTKWFQITYTFRMFQDSV